MSSLELCQLVPPVSAGGVEPVLIPSPSPRHFQRFMVLPHFWNDQVGIDTIVFDASAATVGTSNFQFGVHRKLRYPVHLG